MFFLVNIVRELKTKTKQSGVRHHSYSSHICSLRMSCNQGDMGHIVPSSTVQYSAVYYSTDNRWDNDLAVVEVSVSLLRKLITWEEAGPVAVWLVRLLSFLLVIPWFPPSNSVRTSVNKTYCLLNRQQCVVTSYRVATQLAGMIKGQAAGWVVVVILTISKHSNI